MKAERPTPGFRFEDVTSLELGREDFVAMIPGGLATKEELLAALAHELRFPSWFGANWDALADSLADLSWIPARRVFLVHTGLPLADPGDRGAYVDVLTAALESWRADPAHDLEVVFPPETQLPA